MAVERPELVALPRLSCRGDTSIVVRNTGAGELSVSSVSVPAGIAVNPGSSSVAAGASQVVAVTATGSGYLHALITFNCDDPDEPARTIEVCKNNSTFPQCGSLAPDFNLYGTDGQWHALSADRGKVVYLDFGASW